MKRLTKRFAGNIALDEVDFEVNAGEVHALLGENGAGKSTLIKILAGVHRPDDGEIRMKGRVVDPLVDKLPMTFIHQDLGLVDSMSVAENVAVVAGYPRWRGLISWAAARAAATAAVERMGGGVDANARVGDLSAAEKSIVAIARAMAVNCDLLVLDEPSAALPEADVARLLDVLRRLRESGVGIVYVTHRLDEVFRIADRVTVLRDGRRVATERVGDTNPRDLVYEIVGRSLSNLFPTPPVHGADIVLSRWKIWWPGTSGRSRSVSLAAKYWGSWDCAAPATRLSVALFSAMSRSRAGHCRSPARQCASNRRERRSADRSDLFRASEARRASRPTCRCARIST